MLIFSLDQGEISLKEKKEMQNMLHNAALFIQYEDIFLGKKPKFLKQNMDLRDALQTLQGGIPESLREKCDIKISVPNIVLNTDRNSFLFAFGNLLERLLPEGKNLQVNYDVKMQALLLSNERKEYSTLSFQPLSACLQKEMLETGLLRYQIALRLLKFLGAEPRFLKEAIVLPLKKLLPPTKTEKKKITF